MTILVVGNATVDLTFEVAHLPGPGETVLAQSRMIDAGGKGLNQAIAAARTGAEVIFVAPIGSDTEGEMVRERLRERHLRIESLLVRRGATDQSIIYIDPLGENMIVSTASLATTFKAEEISGLIDSLGPGDFLLMQGNLSRTATEECLERARHRRTRTVPNSAPIAFHYDKLWPLVDIAIANNLESRVLTGVEDPESGANRLRQFGAGVVIVTLGREGALFVSPTAVRKIAAPPTEVVDSSGAGDVFCGVLTGALSQKLSMDHALEYAVKAASLSVTRRGTSTAIPQAAELLDIKKAICHFDPGTTGQF